MKDTAPSSLARLSMSLPAELSHQLDVMVAERGLPSRSQLIAELIRNELAEHGATIRPEDMLAGTIHLAFDQVAGGLPHVQSGALQCYAVTSKTRLAVAPNVPTVDEAGLPGFYMSVWHGLWTAKGTPRDVIERVNAAVIEALGDATAQGAKTAREAFAATPPTGQADLDRVEPRLEPEGLRPPARAPSRAAEPAPRPA